MPAKALLKHQLAFAVGVLHKASHQGVSLHMSAYRLIQHVQSCSDICSHFFVATTHGETAHRWRLHNIHDQPFNYLTNEFQRMMCLAHTSAMSGSHPAPQTGQRWRQSSWGRGWLPPGCATRPAASPACGAHPAAGSPRRLGLRHCVTARSNACMTGTWGQVMQ